MWCAHLPTPARIWSGQPSIYHIVGDLRQRMDGVVSAVIEGLGDKRFTEISDKLGR